MQVRKYFEPFHEVEDKWSYLLLFLQILAICIFLEYNHSEIIPSPLIVLKNFFALITSMTFIDNLIKSFSLIFYAMAIAIVISLSLSYLSVLKFFTKLVEVVCSFRYLTITGLSTLFTFLSTDTGSIRTNLLLFAIVPFFTISMLDIINRTSPQDIELGYTLKKSRWWILKEVVVIGHLDKVFVVAGINFAICWLMLTTVESKAQNLGGLGTMLLIADRHVRLEEILPLLLNLLLIGTIADISFKWLGKLFFKHTR